MNAPITVLMSVYNGECWLHESIESVLGQTHGDFEFIIVNDGSKDASLEIIKDFAARDQRIQIIDKQNTGLADSLNVGINKAAGEWIARIDADDVCESTRLEIQYAIARSRKELVLIGSAVTEMDEAGQLRKCFYYPSSHQELIDNLVTFKSFFAHSSALLRTQAVRNLGGYRQRIKRAEDFDLWLRLSEVGEVACVSKPLVRIRHHAEQVSRDEGGRRQLADAVMALVAYFVRQRGFPDPVTPEGTDTDFIAFQQFVGSGVANNKLYEFHGFVGSLKVRLQTITIASLIDSILLATGSPQFVLRYFHKICFGDSLAQQLANKWIDRGETMRRS